MTAKIAVVLGPFLLVSLSAGCGPRASVVATPVAIPPAGPALASQGPVCLAMQVENNGVMVATPAAIAWLGQASSVSLSGSADVEIDAFIEDHREYEEAAYRAALTYRRDGRIIFEPTLMVKPGHVSSVQLSRAGTRHRVALSISPLHQGALCGALAQK